MSLGKRHTGLRRFCICFLPGAREPAALPTEASIDSALDDAHSRPARGTKRGMLNRGKDRKALGKCPYYLLYILNIYHFFLLLLFFFVNVYG